MPAPFGNTNASKENRLFGDALRRAIAQEDGKRVRESVEQLLTKAANGDLPSIQILAERLDGKAPQAVTLGNAPEETFKVTWKTGSDDGGS